MTVESVSISISLGFIEIIILLSIELLKLRLNKEMKTKLYVAKHGNKTKGVVRNFFTKGRNVGILTRYSDGTHETHNHHEYDHYADCTFKDCHGKTYNGHFKIGKNQLQLKVLDEVDVYYDETNPRNVSCSQFEIDNYYEEVKTLRKHQIISLIVMIVIISLVLLIMR